MTDQISALELTTLRQMVMAEYRGAAPCLPFHGWPHIEFVSAKAVKFANERGADASIVEASALVHDLNYLIKKNSEPEVGKLLRHKLLIDSGINEGAAAAVEIVVGASHTATRGEDVSLEVSALSDADTLFKALPTTALLLSQPYMEENGLSLRAMGDKILTEQIPLLDRGIYFYDSTVAARYIEWAKIGLAIWQAAVASFDDPDVKRLLQGLGYPA